jgi:hypothetical protein
MSHCPAVSITKRPSLIFRNTGKLVLGAIRLTIAKWFGASERLHLVDKFRLE